MKRIHTICRLFICLALLGLLNQSTHAQDEHSQQVTIAISNEQGIHFYTTSESAELIPVGRLPPEIRLADEISDDFWSLTSTNDLVISPDSQKIALTAQRGDDYQLFIYHVVLDTLEQVPVQELYYLSWSPDSAFISLQALDHDYFYDLNQAILQPVNSGFGALYWLPDSSGWIVRLGSHLLMLRREDVTPDLLFDAEPLLTTEAGYLCNFHWSPENQRFYFVTDCYGAVDEKPNEVLYSIDLTGNVQREVQSSLRDFYVEIDSPTIMDIFGVSDTEKYLIIEARDKLLGGVNNIRIAQLHDGQLTDKYVRHFNPYAGYSSAALSPDDQKIAFTSQDWTGDFESNKGFIIIVDLNTGEQIIDDRLTQDPVCDAQWLTSEKLVFISAPDGDCYHRNTQTVREVIELDITTGTIVNLTEDLPGNAWIIR